MKRLQSLLIAILMLLTTVSVTIAPCVTLADTITTSKYDSFTTIANGNFAGNTTGWTKNGEGTVELVTENVAEGSHSLRMKGEAPFYFYQKIYIVPGAEYTLTLQVKGQFGTKGSIKFEFSNTHKSERHGEKCFPFFVGNVVSVLLTKRVCAYIFNLSILS